MAKRLFYKIFRDVQHAPGRFMLMFGALAVSLTALGLVLSAFTISTREMRGNYLGTQPAAATFRMDGVTEDALALARSYPGVAEVEARASHLARVQVAPDVWRPILLFAVGDFKAMKVARFRSEKGAWPPPDGTLLVERSSAPILKFSIGSPMHLRSPGGIVCDMPVSGIVHDPGLAPAWQERMVYGYLGAASLNRLGLPTLPTELKITVKDQSLTRPQIEDLAKGLAAALALRGHGVDEIQVPPPRRHPHEAPSRTVMAMLFVSAFLILILAGILTASLVAEWMVRERRPLGIMKSLGATSGQLLIPYALPVVLMGLLAATVSVGPALHGGQFFAHKVAGLLNLELMDLSVPRWVPAVQFLSGIFIPLLLTLPVLIKAARGSALSSMQVVPAYYGGPGKETRAKENRLLRYALRNTWRKPRRLALTLGLLASAGALFITALELADAWKVTLDRGMATRAYDVEVRFTAAVPIQEIRSSLKNLKNLSGLETWEQLATSAEGRGGFPLVNSYPDGGHGSFSLRGLPENTKMVSFPVMEGRFLNEGETNALVLNHMARPLYPQAVIGDTIQVRVHEKTLAYILVGVVRELGSPAAAYVKAEELSSRLGRPGTATSVRLAWQKKKEGIDPEKMKGLEKLLSGTKFPVGLLITDLELRSAMGEHIGVLVTLLKLLALILAAVGLFGLGAALSAAVAERSREFAVLKTLGATPNEIRRMVVVEALAWALGSAVLGLFASLPLSLGAGQLVGALSFRSPLPLVFSPTGISLWFVLSALGAMGAAYLPARRASALTIRQGMDET